jgi:sn-glycerol 3-phosphate transport system permease protein
MHKRVIFRSWWLPYLLGGLPRSPSRWSSSSGPPTRRWRPRSLSRTRSGFRGHSCGSTTSSRLFGDPIYLASFWTTLVFGLSVTVISMGMALALAVAANRVIRSATTYRTLLIWPYAVAPALAGVLWFFMMNPSLGIIAYWLEAFFGVTGTTTSTGPRR